MIDLLNSLGRNLPQEWCGKAITPYNGPWAYAKAVPNHRFKYPGLLATDKIVKDLDTLIDALKMRDGMTISFHHAIRNGDYVMKMVVDTLARKGLKGLKLAPSSISAVQDCIFEHIENGVITALDTSGIRGKIGDYVKSGRLAEPIIVRSHGGRARAIESGELHIDVAFIAAPACDTQGNINGVEGASACGSMGYAMVDAAHAEQVVAITDNLLPHPLDRISIPQTQVDFIVVVDKIGDPEGIATGSLKFTSNPKTLIISEYAAQVLEYSGCFNDGFSLQLGGGGASLCAAKYIKEKMYARNITASFGVGGSTGVFTDMLAEGLVQKLYDTQSFDIAAIQSLRTNPKHIEISAAYYASAGTKGPIINKLDAVILGATEVDVNFNVNTLTGSNGVFMGAIGGHADIAATSGLSMVVLPLFRGRFPVIRKQVRTITTPGETVDVIITERGIAVNPRRQDLVYNFKYAGLPIMSIDELQSLAYKIAGTPEDSLDGDKVVALVEYRDGSIIDTVKSKI